VVVVLLLEAVTLLAAESADPPEDSLVEGPTRE
jgi:hypothetical protein